MRHPSVLWILATILTLASAVYQRMTGPTYPLSGSITLAGKEIPYRFERSHGGDTDHDVVVNVPDSSIQGELFWKRHGTEDPWSILPMAFRDGGVRAALPHQPPAGKLDYSVVLRSGEESAVLPREGGVVIRFKGDVPLWVLITHVIVIFVAMLLSTRTGLEYFRPEQRVRSLASWTLGFAVVGGLILGPVVQWYAFGAFWTGWPFGHDLTDNKTLVAVIAWVVAFVAIRKSRQPAAWALGAAVVMLVVFLIPHSVLGSELDYRALDAAAQTK